MESYNILCLAGDGIGLEVMIEAKKILSAISRKFKINIDISDGLIGGIAIDQEGSPISNETIKRSIQSDFVLLGAVGGPKWDNLETNQRPEAGLLKIRKEMNLFANLRPIKVFNELIDASPLKKEYISDLDLMIVRELVCGLYFGKPAGIDMKNGEKHGYNTMSYTESEIGRILDVAFDLAKKRSGKVCSVDKANVLHVMKLWRDVAIETHKKYPNTELTHMYVDAMAMDLVKCPKKYDVLVMENMFGDILSDIASQLTGSIGMLASASIGNVDHKKTALYEPVHGSAPDIMGKGIANPIAMILSVAMAFKYSLNKDDISNEIELAVKSVLKNGFRTSDIQNAKTNNSISTSQMGDEIVKSFEKK